MQDESAKHLIEKDDAQEGIFDTQKSAMMDSIEQTVAGLQEIQTS